MKASEFLKKAKALIDTPDHWTVEACARNSSDTQVSIISLTACKFCSLGALGLAEFKSNLLFDTAVRDRADIYLCNEMGVISIFNDTHCHSEVMAAWDRAIAFAEYTGD